MAASMTWMNNSSCVDLLRAARLWRPLGGKTRQRGGRWKLPGASGEVGLGRRAIGPSYPAAQVRGCFTGKVCREAASVTLHRMPTLCSCHPGSIRLEEHRQFRQWTGSHFNDHHRTSRQSGRYGGNLPMPPSNRIAILKPVAKKVVLGRRADRAYTLRQQGSGIKGWVAENSFLKFLRLTSLR